MDTLLLDLDNWDLTVDAAGNWAVASPPYAIAQDVASAIKTFQLQAGPNDPVLGECWYDNTRKSIGVGKPVPVPATLDWDLWQGPAPRQPYKDNVQPYNWHWFRIWGTGETLNNGTHEVDVCRWALGVDYPQRITASGGRYQFKDDWQFYDTLVTSFEYEDRTLSWEGKSCEGMKERS